MNDSKSIVPTQMQDYYSDWHYSPAVESNGFVFVSGCTGQRLDDSISDEPVEQFVQAFENVKLVLATGGLGFADVVEMTTYHVGLNKHLDEFMQVKDQYINEPYPAWTAIGISELAGSDNSIIEIRVTARRTNVP